MHRRVAAPLLGLALLLAAGCGARAPEAAPTLAAADGRAQPKRIVSINPCVDAVLKDVADPRTIAGISHYSQDPRATSTDLAWAGRFRATSGSAEEVVALSPDLVIAGAHVDPSTVAMLARLGIPLVQVGVPQTVAESVGHVRTIAAAIGRRQPGEALVARIEGAVAAARPTGQGGAIPALIWQGGGMVPGTGTLAGDMLGHAGFRNMSADYGLQQWDVLPLEPLVARPPRVLLSISADARQDRMLGHPVIAALKQRIAVRPFPERLLHCGGPTIITAMHHLARIRNSL